MVSSTGVILIAQAFYSDFDSLPREALSGLVRESTDLIKDGLEFNLAYSVARQWWGEAVSAGRGPEHFTDDALATYFALLYYADRYGREAVEEQIEQQLRAVYRVYRTFGGQDLRVAGPVDRFQNRFQYRAIVHTKGALYLHRMQGLIGAAHFDRAIGRFYADNRWRTGPAASLAESLSASAQENSRVIEKCYKRWLTERRGDEDIAKPEYRIIVAMKLSPSREGRPSAFERLGRLIVRQMTRVGKAAVRPF